MKRMRRLRATAFMALLTHATLLVVSSTSCHPRLPQTFTTNLPWPKIYHQNLAGGAPAIVQPILFESAHRRGQESHHRFHYFVYNECFWHILLLLKNSSRNQPSAFGVEGWCVLMNFFLRTRKASTPLKEDEDDLNAARCHMLTIARQLF
jgi:hypothetical protein